MAMDVNQGVLTVDCTDDVVWDDYAADIYNARII